MLIGGLGLGYSLQRVLELVGPNATVHVAELLPEVVAWNREFLGSVNGELLNDPRVKVLVRDVFEVIRQAPKPSYDAILLDVDNGPTSFVQAKNSRIYKRSGFESHRPHAAARRTRRLLVRVSGARFPANLSAQDSGWKPCPQKRTNAQSVSRM